jgi:hypothetical protein
LIWDRHRSMDGADGASFRRLSTSRERNGASKASSLGGVQSRRQKRNFCSPQPTDGSFTCRRGLVNPAPWKVGQWQGKSGPWIGEPWQAGWHLKPGEGAPSSRLFSFSGPNTSPLQPTRPYCVTMCRCRAATTVRTGWYMPTEYFEHTRDKTGQDAAVRLMQPPPQVDIR